MRNYFALVKVQFLSFFGLNKVLHQDKSKRLSGFGGMAIFALIFVGAIGYMGYVYSDTFGNMLLLSGEVSKLLPLMLALSCMVAFFFSFYAVASMLYGYRDYELLMAMPIKTTTIVFAKFTFTYLADLLFSIILLVPSVISYYGFGVTLSVEEFASFFVMLLVSPLLPIAISVFIGALVSYLSSRFRKKNLAQTIMLLCVLAGCFVLGFLDGASNIDYTKIIGKIYFIMPLAVESLFSSSDLLLFIAVNLLPFVGVLLLTAVTYKFMNTLIKSKKKSRKFTIKSYESSTQRKTLIKKEVKRLFSDANYAMNSVIGPILGVAGTIVMCVTFKSMGVKNELLFIFPVLFAFAFMVAPPTNCSISLEGNSFWIIKTAPVSIKNLLLNKLLVNVIFGVAPAFIAGLVGTIILGVTWYECIIISVIGASISMLGGAVGLTFDLLFPKMKWESVVEVVKRSTSVFLTMLAAFVYTAVCFVIGYFMPLSALWNLIIVLVLTVVLVVALHIIIFTKGEKYIAEKT